MHQRVFCKRSEWLTKWLLNHLNNSRKEETESHEEASRVSALCVLYIAEILVYHMFAILAFPTISIDHNCIERIDLTYKSYATDQKYLERFSGREFAHIILFFIRTSEIPHLFPYNIVDYRVQGNIQWPCVCQ